MTPDTTYAGPFGRAVNIYRAAGWRGVLPIGRAPGKKYPPPAAFTGHGKPDPSGPDLQAWLDGPEVAYNVGLRLPAGVIGLDVDAYSGKHGGESLAELEARLGPLPPTWITSARTDGVSGIRLFRVPTELDGREINWPGEAGKHIEIIQHGHRYAVVWPSTNPEAAGAEYRWWHSKNPDAYQRTDPPVPRVDDLPWLSTAWVRGLALSYDRTEKSDLAGSELAAWWDELRRGPACPVVHKVWMQAVVNLRDVDGSRHETARDAAAALARLGGEGHVGVPDVMAQLAVRFAEAVGADRVADGEWSRLLSGAVKLAAADNPRPRQSCPDDAATALPAAMMPPVPESFSQPVGAPVAVDAPAGGLTLPDEFWAARESLAKIRQAAHSRVRSGDVVFYGSLCRIAAVAPHTLRADTGIGTPASLNLFAAVVGPSGGGKSSGLSVGRELVKEGARQLEEFPLGSGEGIAEAYMGEAMQPTGEMAKDGSEKLVKVRTMVRHNVLFHSDEGNSLNKLIERSGSTVGETLRSAWSGETIGQKNGRAETTRTVPARAYAAGLVIGYQPTTVLPLLADVESGTPQRFLYCWAVDATIPPRSARVAWPDHLISPFPPETPTDIPAPGAIVSAPRPPMLGESVTFAEVILDELYETEHAKNSGTLPAGHPLLDPFRSQHPVLKVKIASLLALLEGRRNVDVDDWRLAQIVIDTSDRVREYLQALARAAAGKARAAHEAAESALEWHRAHARAAVTSALETTAERRLAARVAVWVHEGGQQTLGALRKRAASRDRPLVEAAIELAVESGWLVYGGPDAKLHPGPSRPTL